MSQHPSFQSRLNRDTTAAAELAATSGPPAFGPASQRYADRACCCPAQPAVMTVMPPVGGRRPETELLLCWHHYRVSKTALAAAGATILDMRGQRLEGDYWPGDPR